MVDTLVGANAEHKDLYTYYPLPKCHPKTCLSLTSKSFFFQATEL